MLIVDSGPLVAFLNQNDPDHSRCARLLESHDGDLLITPYVLVETCYLVQKYIGPHAEINLVESVAMGDFVQVNPDADDLSRIAELMSQYRGFPLAWRTHRSSRWPSVTKSAKWLPSTVDISMPSRQHTYRL
jgi:predicted nucleic acid-binding protein